MVIVFPGNKNSLAGPTSVKDAGQRSPSFRYALTVSLVLSLLLWAGVAVLARL